MRGGVLLSFSDASLKLRLTRKMCPVRFGLGVCGSEGSVGLREGKERKKEAKERKLRVQAPKERSGGFRRRPVQRKVPKMEGCGCPGTYFAVPNGSKMESKMHPGPTRAFRRLSEVPNATESTTNPKFCSFWTLFGGQHGSKMESKMHPKTVCEKSKEKPRKSV